MTTYYVDSRAAGANDGDPDAGTGPDADGVYQDAFQSIASITGVGANSTIVFVPGSGPYRLAGTAWAGEANGVTVEGNFCTISGGVDLNDGHYKWTQSAANPLEYYCEAAAGGDPSISSFSVARFNGRFFESAAEEDEYQIGTVGSLADGFIGYGDNDSLGYDTVYVRQDGADIASLEVDVSQVSYCWDANWTSNVHKELIFELANLSPVRERNASTTNLWLWCIAKYANGTGFSDQGAGINTHIGCVGYYVRRLVAQAAANSSGTTNAYNCALLKGHLFALMDSDAVSPPTMNIYNCIGFLQSNGAIDKKDADATLNEGGNCWWPSLNGGTNALGYVSTANWTTTAATDFPPSAATTISTVSALEAAGGVDPLLIANGTVIDSDTVKTLTDADLIALALSASSPVITAGEKWWGDAPRPQGIDGEPFPDFGISIGAVQSKDVPFHPANM